jgi:hypothetical protein
MAELDAPLEAVDAAFGGRPGREAEERLQAGVREPAAYRLTLGRAGIIARDRRRTRRQALAHAAVAGAGDGLQCGLERELGEDVGETA